MDFLAENPVEVRLTRRLDRLERKLIRIEALLYRILGVSRNETTRGADQHDEASSGNGEEEESRRHVW